jgi:hypothetical protein
VMYFAVIDIGVRVGVGAGHVHIRKKRNVSSVMGWLLRRQLRLPGAGVCCAVSMSKVGVVVAS